MTSTLCRCLLICIAIFVVTAGGAAASDDLIHLRDGEAAYSEFEARKQVIYDEINRRFAETRAANPDDVDLAIAHCQFLDLMSDESFGGLEESIYDQADDCDEGLKLSWPDAPQVRIRSASKFYSEHTSEDAEALWQTAETWPDAQRRELAYGLRWVYWNAGDNHRAGAMAVHAVQLGDTRVLTNAVDHLLAEDRHADAARLFDGLPAAEFTWQANQRIRQALRLPDPSIARDEFDRQRQDDHEIEPILAARVALATGDIDTAEALIATIEGFPSSLEAHELGIDLALARDDFSQAAERIAAIDTEELFTLSKRYLALVRLSPWHAWAPSLLPITFVAVLLILALALIPGLLLAPAHHRGLMLRLRGHRLEPLFASIGLRHAWFGLAMMLVAQDVFFLFVDPNGIDVLFSDDPEVSLASRSISALAASLLCLLAVRRLSRHEWLGQRTHRLEGLLAALAAWGAVYAVTLINNVVLDFYTNGADTSTEQTRVIRSMIEAGLSDYGLWPTLLSLAVLTPIFEELVFRVLLLGGLTRHIGFAWANVSQAILFAAIHFDLPRFAFYFTMALLAGWLVRRYRTIWPAILLHALINGLAVTIASQP